MKKTLQVLEKAYNAVLVIMTAIIVLLGMYQVVGRNLSFVDTSWTEEAMRYIYVGIIMLGLGCVAKAESFTSITIISDLLDRKVPVAGRILAAFKCVVQVVCFGILFWYGLQLMMSAGNRVAATTRVTFDIIYAPIPIGAFLALIFSVLQLINIFLKGGKENG